MHPSIKDRTNNSLETLLERNKTENKKDSEVSLSICKISYGQKQDVNSNLQNNPLASNFLLEALELYTREQQSLLVKKNNQEIMERLSNLENKIKSIENGVIKKQNKHLINYESVKSGVEGAIFGGLAGSVFFTGSSFYVLLTTSLIGTVLGAYVGYSNYSKSKIKV